ncbi:MAG: hypothetical protein ACM3SW_20720, partial [Actinomycetota bacterium]
KRHQHRRSRAQGLTKPECSRSPEHVNCLRELDIVRRVNPAITEQLKVAAMAVGFLLLGRGVFLHPDRALRYTKARDVSPDQFVRTLIRVVALVLLLMGSWVLCSSVFDYAAPALLHAHPSAFRLITKVAAVLLAVVSVSIGKRD